VLNISNADHAETAPEGQSLVVSKLVCSLAGQTETVTLLPGTLAAAAYGSASASEQFACNYGLNPLYSGAFFDGDLRASGLGPRDEVRLIELVSHPFFVASLFLLQSRSSVQQPHPLILAFVRAAAR